MNKVLAIMYLYPNANPLIDFIVQDDSDGNGPYIARWNVTAAEGIDVPKPIEAELQAAWAAYEEAEANKPPKETDAQKIARLEVENTQLKQRQAQMDGDFAAFVDQYYIDNPDKA